MLSIILLILAMVAAYFGYKNIRKRHIARSRYDTRTSEHVPNKLNELNGQKGAYNATFNGKHEQTDQSETPLPIPHDSPSLLYAERKDTDEEVATQSTTQPTTGQTNDQTNDGQISRAENLPTNGSFSESDTLDLTAETATLSGDEVGIPANSSAYSATASQEHAQSAVETDAFKSAETKAANAQTHANDAASMQASHQSPNDSASDQSSGTSAGVTIGAIAAGVAGTTAAASISSSSSSQQQSDNHATAASGVLRDTHESVAVLSGSESIDLELGESTSNAEQELNDDDHDELLDFGDLTADISEMLKELNLRESDSPRLEINEEEYQQLKTGEPGEVKPEKIENVAGKLRNMLQ